MDEVTIAASGSEYLSLDISGYEMDKVGITFTIYAEAEGYVSSSVTFLLRRELGAVTNLEIDSLSDSASWDAVKDAEGYEVTVTYGEETLSETVTDTYYSFKYYGEGLEIEITVKPVAKGWYSEDSAASRKYTKTTIAAPFGLGVSGTKISWSPVGEASGYVLRFNDEYISVSETWYDISEGAIDIGDTNTISVMATAADSAKNSQWSDTLTVSGGDVSTTEVIYADGYVTWNYILGVSDYTVTVTSTSGANAGTAGDIAGSTAPVTFTRSGDITITVSWKNSVGNEASSSVSVYVYALTFSTAGGNSVNPLYYAYGDTMTLPDATYSSSDANFGGWYTQADTGTVDDEQYMGSGTKVESGEKFVWTENTVLYAYWVSVRFMVTLNLGNYGIMTDDNGEDIASVTVAKGSTTYTLPVPESDDPAYAFVGWFSDLSLTYGYYWEGHEVWNTGNGNGVSTRDEEEGKRYTSLDGSATKSVSGNITLYAKWIQILDFDVTTVNGETCLTVGAHYEYENAYYDSGLWYTTYMVEWYGITEITVPETYTIGGVTYTTGAVSSSAFEDCTSLKVINLPDTVMNIPVSGDGYTSGPFANDSSLEAVNIYQTSGEPSLLTEVVYFSDEGVLYEYSTLYGYAQIVYYPQAKAGDYVILSYVSNPRMLDTSGNVMEVAVTNIPSQVFTGKNAGTITIPASVETIASLAFCDANIKYIVFEEGTQTGTLTIGENAFQGSSIIAINLPLQLASFDTGIFADCASLEAVNVAGTATGNGYSSSDGVLYNASGTEIVFYPLGKSVTDGTYNISGSVTEIGAHAFEGVKLTSIVIPSSVQRIGESAFEDCESLSSLTFQGDAGSNKLYIETRAFHGCSKLTTVTLPVNLAGLAAYSFGATGIKTVTYDSWQGATVADLSGLEDYAFSSAGSISSDSKVETLNIGANVPEIAFSSIFGGPNLTTINIASGNDNFFTDGNTGALYGKETGNLYYVPADLSGNFTYPAGYEPTVIYAETFKGTKITSITIPSTVEQIDSSAFYGCTSLTTVTFLYPEGEEQRSILLGDYAFYGCTALETIELPSCVRQIGTGVFDNCSSLKSVTIKGLNDGKNNGYIGVKSGILYEFSGTSDPYATRIIVNPAKNEETVIVVYATIPGIDAYIFANSKAEEISFEGTASSSFYIEQETFANNATLKKIQLPEGLTTIQTSLFQSATALEEVIIPTTVTQIYAMAFNSATALKSVTFTGVEDGTRTASLTFVNNGASFGAGQNGAFAYTTSLETIVLPENTVMVEYTFGYSGLKSITVPAGTTTVPERVFYGSKSLETVVLAEGITGIGRQAFGNCTGIKYLTIPSTLSYISFKDAFDGCHDTCYYFTVTDGNTSYKSIDGVLYSISGDTITGITRWSKVTTSATIPAEITSISATLFGNSAIETLVFSAPVTFTDVTSSSTPFSGCKALKSVTFAEGQTSIQNYVFMNSSLESVVIPSTVTEIGAYAFYGCTHLATVTLSGTGSLSVGAYAFYACPVSLTVDDNITSIGEFAFAHSGVTSVTLSSSITVLAASAFEQCDSLTTVIIPSTTVTVGARAFYGCEALSSLTLSEGVSRIGDSTFAGCTSLTAVTIPLSVTEIGASSFADCSNLTTIGFATGTSSLADIGDYAFARTGITSFSFPETVNGSINLGAELFKKLELQTLYISLSVKDVGKSLNDCQVEKFEVAEGHEVYETAEEGTVLKTHDGTEVKRPPREGELQIDTGTKIEDNTYQNDAVTEVTIYAGITEIGEYAFANCSNLTTVTIAEGASIKLGAHAFDGCTLLTTINIGAFSSIGDYAFYDCGLTSLDVPTVTSGAYAFAGNTSLATINVSSGSGFSDHMFDGDIAIATVDLSAVSSVSGQYVFAGCTGIGTLTWCSSSSVPSYFLAEAGMKKFDGTASVTAINSYAFYGCSALEEVTFKSSLTSIPEHAFDGCSALKTVDISAATSLGEYAFLDCSSLDNLDPATNLSTPGTGCFMNCSSLASFVFKTTVTVINTYVFYGCSSLAEVSGVGSGSGSVNNDNKVYDYAFYGCSSLTSFDFTKIHAIGDHAFEGCGFVSITINTYANLVITSSGSYVFANCLSLTTVDFVNGLQVLDYMFYGCTSLVNVRLLSVTSIREGAFAGCTSLETIYNPNGTTISTTTGWNTDCPATIVSENWTI
ncbi:MAG: leucine-rich repeat protein [Bacteroidales bacterium]|nr:leucine-rich repeat protein [Bacteroidales bacterium]